MNIKAVTAIAGVFLGCMSNMVFLELLVKNDPSVGSLTTFLQFAFIALYGFIYISKFGTVKAHIPIMEYVSLVIMFFLTNVMNNMAFDYKIPVPLHMIFRSGSLIANMIMGIFILNKTYTLLKYLSVLMITIGITICTLLSSNQDSNQSPDNFFWWVIGITLLTVALLVSARMGISQERIFKQYGKHPMEALYYSHLFSLPGFIFVYNDILKYFVNIMPGPRYTLPILGDIPLQWVFLAGNVITQFLCISSVYTLTTECTSLTVTLVLTLRKFTSLLLSIIYFRNPFTLGHWLGTFLVFGGTLIFTEVPQTVLVYLQPSKKSAKKVQ